MTTFEAARKILASVPGRITSVQIGLNVTYVPTCSGHLDNNTRDRHGGWTIGVRTLQFGPQTPVPYRGTGATLEAAVDDFLSRITADAPATCGKE